MPGSTVIVRSYSGRTYAERPVSFVWQGDEYVVEAVESEWLEPGERHFDLRTRDGGRFHLSYDGIRDCWSLVLDR